MLRQSARLKPKARLELGDLEVDFEPDDKDDTEFEAKQTRKRRKITTNAAGATVRKPRGNRGKLQQLTEFPLDVLFEIFGHLSPLDVLHLARTTKALRGILMRRSAISVWKQARANDDDIPDCPSDLTEPQYANLAFGSHCHFCLAPHAPNVFWDCRTRCCKQCFPQNFIDTYSLAGKYSFPFDPSRLLPSCHQMVRRRRRGPNMHNIHQAQIFAEEYTKIKDDAERMTQWMEEKENALQERTLHSNLCEKWHRRRGCLRSQELHDIRERRREAILQKLRELGWGENVDHINHYGDGGLLSHALVRQGKELTERIWNNIKPTLIEFLQDQREKRLKAARRQRLMILAEIIDQERARSEMEIIPSIADIAHTDPFRTVIESSTMVSRECFSEAMKELPRLIQQWRTSKDQELLKVVNSYLLKSASERTENGNSLARLELATTFFKCSSCSDPISHPRILGHHDMSRYRLGSQAEDDLTDDLAGILSSLYHQPWNHGGDRVTFHDLAFNAARSIVQACGLNPDTATVREMEDLNPLIECRHCRDPNGARLVMRWRWAVYHSTDVHPKATAWSWLLLSSEDKALASLEEARPSYNGRNAPDTSTQYTSPKPIRFLPEFLQSQGGSS